jgi:hypothetical protein
MANQLGRGAIPIGDTITVEHIEELVGGGETDLHSHAGGGGAATPQTDTATVTTDTNTFIVGHVFDLGHATTVYLKMTVLALTPDGETFGNGAGQIGVDMTFGATPGPTAFGVSRDGVTYAHAGGQGIEIAIAVAVDGVVDFQVTSPRFVKPCVVIYDNDSGDVYAGANNPTAQARIDIEYL